MNNNILYSAISKELDNKSLDIARDYSEIALDSFLESGIIKELPLVKSLSSFYSISNSINERNKIRNILSFFQQFHSGGIDDLKFNQFRHKFTTDQNYHDRVIETIILLNERFLHALKSKILANFLIEHINQKLNWDELEDLSSILDNIHPKALKCLKDMQEDKYGRNMGETINRQSLLISSGLASTFEDRCIVNGLGRIFYNFGIKNLEL